MLPPFDLAEPLDLRPPGDRGANITLLASPEQHGHAGALGIDTGPGRLTREEPAGDGKQQPRPVAGPGVGVDGPPVPKPAQSLERLFHHVVPGTARGMGHEADAARVALGHRGRACPRAVHHPCLRRSRAVARLVLDGRLGPFRAGFGSVNSV